MRARLRDEMLELYSAAAARSDDPAQTPEGTVDQLMRPKLDTRDAHDEWWTGAFASDHKEDVDVRLNELLNAIKFASGSTLVLVSHSNICRALLGRRVLHDLTAAKPELTASAKAHKMKNCAMVRIELDFTRDLRDCIVDMEPLFVENGDAFERKHPRRGASPARQPSGARGLSLPRKGSSASFLLSQRPAPAPDPTGPPLPPVAPDEPTAAVGSTSGASSEQPPGAQAPL